MQSNASGSCIVVETRKGKKRQKATAKKYATIYFNYANRKNRFKCYCKYATIFFYILILTSCCYTATARNNKNKNWIKNNLNLKKT